MDHIRTITQETIFTVFRPEFHFPLPDDRKPNLKDIALFIVTKAGPGVSFKQAGCHNIRLYVDGTDITAAYLRVLRGMIDAANQPQVKQQYEAAMARWLKYAAAMGAAYGAPDLAQERARAAQLAATVPLSSLLSNIGDYTHGYSGHLHFLNFHDQFGIASAVSLGKVLAVFNAGSPKKLNTIDAKTLTISSGHSATLDPAYDITKDLARGAALVRFELIYHDPLEDVVQALQGQFDKLRATIEQSLATILQNLSTGGPIQRRLNVVEQQINSTQQLIDQAKRDVSNQAVHLGTLEATLADIRRIVASL